MICGTTDVFADHAAGPTCCLSASALARCVAYPPPAETSTSVLGNLPLAVLAVVTLRAGFSCLERQQRAKLRDARDARAWRSEAPPTTPAPTFGVPPSAAKPDSWRKYVRAPVVEEAWAKFCGSIVQEVGAQRCGQLER